MTTPGRREVAWVLTIGDELLRGEIVDSNKARIAQRLLLLDLDCRHQVSVLDDPATKVFVANLGDSSVDFNVRPWCKTDDYWDVYSDLLESAKVELEAAGCSIPYPQTDVHLHKVKKQGD